MRRISTIVVGDDVFEYTIQKRRTQKKSTIRIYKEGRVSVTIPYMFPLSYAHAYISKHKTWVQRVFKEQHIEIPQTYKEQIHHYVQHREAARKFVTQRLCELNSAYGFSYGRIAIRNSVSRWGSCSTLQNLNFHYKIIFLPVHLQDYIITHELCHLRIMNHSKQFWNLVAQTLPHYAKLRKELRDISLR